jgi:peptidoglycan/LPS O-acetylase OafA/YrhL
MTPTTRTPKLPSLDGWRAISIALVLLAHSSHTAGFPARFHPVSDVFNIGVLGVRFFFVISGFLITWLLLQEKEKYGRINLKFFLCAAPCGFCPSVFCICWSWRAARSIPKVRRPGWRT